MLERYRQSPPDGGVYFCSQSSLLLQLICFVRPEFVVSLEVCSVFAITGWTYPAFVP